jgi:crotonobetainyl-CoA:carnitine CoA-transferase CaiB-like acyl-CoA transferase
MGGVRAAVCGLLLAACGATVVRIEASGGDALRVDAKLARNLLRGIVDMVLLLSLLQTFTLFCGFVRQT